MVEQKSDTSDVQRFDEMWLHLTPRGATVPYSVCHDSDGNVWVATKGGLFKFDGNRRTTMWERKNLFPKKMAPFPQVAFHNGTIVYTCAEDKERTTELRFFTMSGEMIHEQFIDGLFISLTISDNGDMFMSKQPTGSDSTPLAWEEVIKSSADGFYALCALDNNTLVAAMSTRPVNMFSKQRMVLIDTNSGKIRLSFSKEGKKSSDIFFPRAIRKYGDDMIIMDKSGRFMCFSTDGKYKGLLAEIDAYLANGFCIKDNAALMALSGVVLDHNRTICDDWLEWIDLDGSSWRKQREQRNAKKVST
uniref:Two component regulator propeller n=1 Tax=Angiostrongylus cantonensis TaxID=6313 RepID=A0A0K0DFK7_ANGCA